MTTRDYRILARVLREAREAPSFHEGTRRHHETIVEMMVEALKEQNPRFDREIFERESLPESLR